LNSNVPLFNEVEGRLARSADTSDADPRAIATRDHEAIRRWGARHRAEPATGEATTSGPATIHVRDGGAGIRLNFPGAGRFRPITWDEWFENFERHYLTFVYEEEIADPRTPCGKLAVAVMGRTATTGSRQSGRCWDQRRGP
jgi:hypothetical protein